MSVKEDWLSPARPLSIAHRGASAYAPENTLEAFEVAASLGADMWEVDLRLTADGQIIAFHDHLADGRMVEELSYSDIRSIVSPDQAPLFSDVITLAQHRDVGIYADIKVNDAAVPASNMLAAHGVKRAIISTRDPMMIGVLASANCPYPRAILVPPDADPFDYANANADIIHLCWKGMACPQDMLDDAFFARSTARGQKIVLWHEEDPWRMTKLRKKPVLGICSNRPELVKPFFMNPDWPVQIVCHRGANKLAPENSLPAMHAVFAAGFSHVELDVNVTSDDQLVVIHDAMLGRTTNGAGRVSDYPLEELRKLDAGEWFSPYFRGERIPTLEEALNLAKTYQGKLYIEIKNAPVANIWNMVMSSEMENDCFFWSFTTSLLHELRALSPIPRIMTRRQDFASLEASMNFLEPAIVEFTLSDDWSEIKLLRTSDIAAMIAYNGSNRDIFSKIAQVRPDMVNLDQPFLFADFIMKDNGE